ncbi:MAG: hypothetical protein HOK41_14450 [Nitrospina sp.]|nr:hypothetical protein [Nitrospina sp.]
MSYDRHIDTKFRVMELQLENKWQAEFEKETKKMREDYKKLKNSLENETINIVKKKFAWGSTLLGVVLAISIWIGLSEWKEMIASIPDTAKKAATEVVHSNAAQNTIDNIKKLGVQAENNAFKTSLALERIKNNIEKVVGEFKNNTEFQNTVADIIKKDDKFESRVADIIKKDDKFASKIAGEIKADDKFEAGVADRIKKDDKFEAGVAGRIKKDDKFEAGVAGRIKADPNFYSKLEKKIQADNKTEPLLEKSAKRKTVQQKKTKNNKK